MFDDAERGEAGGMRDGVASSSIVGAFPVSPAGFCSAAGAEPRGLNTHSPRPGREAAAETHDALWEEVGALRAVCRVSQRHAEDPSAASRRRGCPKPAAAEAPALQAAKPSSAEGPGLVPGGEDSSPCLQSPPAPTAGAVHPCRGSAPARIPRRPPPRGFGVGPGRGLSKTQR